MDIILFIKIIPNIFVFRCYCFSNDLILMNDNVMFCAMKKRIRTSCKKEDNKNHILRYKSDYHFSWSDFLSLYFWLVFLWNDTQCFSKDTYTHTHTHTHMYICLCVSFRNWSIDIFHFLLIVKFDAVKNVWQISLDFSIRFHFHY